MSDFSDMEFRLDEIKEESVKTNELLTSICDKLDRLIEIEQSGPEGNAIFEKLNQIILILDKT